MRQVIPSAGRRMYLPDKESRILYGSFKKIFLLCEAIIRKPYQTGRACIAYRQTMNRFALAILTSLLSMGNTFGLHAADHKDRPRKVVHLLEADFRPGNVFQTHAFFKGENASQQPIRQMLSGHLKYGFRFTPETYFGKRYPYAIQGIGIGYNTFHNRQELGNPLSVYVFQSSRIARLAPRLSLDYEWNFGASFGWKEYNETTNPYNIVVGSPINAYIHLEFLLNWQLAAHSYLRAGVGVSHYSNGNSNYPNAGVNTVEASIGFIRTFGQEEQHLTPGKGGAGYGHRHPFKPYINYDLIFYGATRKKGIFPEAHRGMLVPGIFAIGGMNFNPLYNFNKYFRAGLSLDAQYDESANILEHIANEEIPSQSDELKFYRPPFKDQFSVGLSLRTEIVMPIFSINLGIGKNFIYHGKDTRSFYQVFVLKTNLSKRFFLHTGYQLYRFKDPNNLMLGIGFRFNEKRR